MKLELAQSGPEPNKDEILLMEIIQANPNLSRRRLYHEQYDHWKNPLSERKFGLALNSLRIRGFVRGLEIERHTSYIKLTETGASWLSRYQGSSEGSSKELQIEPREVDVEGDNLALRDSISEAILKLSFRDQYPPTVTEILTSVGESRENQHLRDFVYRVGTPLGWKLPTQEDHDGSPARVWGLLALGAIIDTKNTQRKPEDLWSMAPRWVGKKLISLARSYARAFPERSFRIVRPKRGSDGFDVTLRIPYAVVEQYRRLEGADKQGSPLNFGAFTKAYLNGCQIEVNYPRILVHGNDFFKISPKSKNSTIRLKRLHLIEPAD